MQSNKNSLEWSYGLPSFKLYVMKYLKYLKYLGTFNNLPSSFFFTGTFSDVRLLLINNVCLIFANEQSNTYFHSHFYKILQLIHFDKSGHLEQIPDADIFCINSFFWGEGCLITQFHLVQCFSTLVV